MAVVLDDRITENSGTLNITMATFQDAGEYMCVASNELSNITSSPVRLTVQGVCACDSIQLTLHPVAILLLGVLF